MNAATHVTPFGAQLTISIAAVDVENHHRLAQAAAMDAVEHARSAGRLLLRAKAELPRGQFLSWLAANVTATPRTAQRYMHAAAPNPKCDRLSYSPRPPKPGSARAARILEIDRRRHRDTVVAHVVYLVAELPTAGNLRDADRDVLELLRARIDSILGAV